MKKGFGNKINNKGFTLVEVLIAITILLIVSSALLALFANSYRDIEISGIKNKELYKIQDKLEESISLDNASEKKDLIISFPGIEQHIKIPGRIHSEKTEIQGKQIAISVFVPEQ
ncbi:MAG: prepilin-type N-terminal cleavage/methylation domain-containing protein [Clostridiales bacterium]|nr:prepilin-type N-terminal cleavage/methylation domain-containing protein [Clostridiales bacterium]